MMETIVAGVIVAVSLAAVALSRWRTASVIRRLDEMVTSAIDGNFSEKTFEESRLSALESRWARYLTASVRASQDLKIQKDRISGLISDISHQTKTPVANLQLYTQMLEEQPLSPQERDCVRAISSQTEKLQILMEALVKTSRLETGLLSLHPQAEEIASVVEHALAQYVPKAACRKIALVCGNLEGSAVFDPKWTEEAICNLLDNAVKYTPCGGKITVEVRNYEMFSAVRVTDTGPGISEEEQAKIFGRFYRSHNVYQMEGLGIGLYLTRQIAENQGGYIKVESTPGGGSTFSLYLPRK
jgi:signal transduction histidine kinase